MGTSISSALERSTTVIGRITPGLGLPIQSGEVGVPRAPARGARVPLRIVVQKNVQFWHSLWQMQPVPQQQFVTSGRSRQLSRHASQMRCW